MTIRPNRPLAQIFAHGTVAAAWGVDKSTGVARGADWNFYVTDVLVDAVTDLTAEIDTAESIQMRAVIHNDTTSADVVALTFGIPQNTHVSLKSPIMLKVNNQYATHVQLGGAATCATNIYLIGFEH